MSQVSSVTFNTVIDSLRPLQKGPINGRALSKAFSTTQAFLAKSSPDDPNEECVRLIWTNLQTIQRFHQRGVKLYLPKDLLATAKKISERAEETRSTLFSDPSTIVKHIRNDFSYISKRQLNPSLMGSHRFEIRNMFSLPPDPHLIKFYGVNCQGALMLECGELDLFKWVEKQHPVSIKDVYNIALNIAQGLASMHQHGFIHRDIKPENIVISTSSDGFSVKLIDFDFMKFLTKKEQKNPPLVKGRPGTKEYFAPELCESPIASGTHAIVPLQLSSDVWSYGLTLYFLLTGQDLTCLLVDKDPLSYNDLYLLFQQPHSELKARITSYIGLIPQKLNQKKQISEEEREMLQKLLDILSTSLHLQPTMRPSMQQVAHILSHSLNRP